MRLWLKKSATAVSDFAIGENAGQLDLPRMRRGQFMGGMFAVFVPSRTKLSFDELNKKPYDSVPFAQAQKVAHQQLDLFRRLVAEVPGKAFEHCVTVADIEAAIARGSIAAVLHMEGAEAIAPDLGNIEQFHAQGLRSLGPVWSRDNAFGHGVPFRWPSTNDTGPGLTAQGKELVAACNKLKIVVDVSHSNAKAFWDITKITTAPIIATHCNAHALTPSSRCLTDDQLKAIRESKGIVGLNYAIDFLQNNGSMDPGIAPEVMIRQLEHMITFAGEDCVGLGSDFDGATIPSFMRDVAGLPRLVAAMEQAQFGARLIEKITHQNWLRVLRLSWGA